MHGLQSSPVSLYSWNESEGKGEVMAVLAAIGEIEQLGEMVPFDRIPPPFRIVS
jgi:hypothetical protein